MPKRALGRHDLAPPLVADAFAEGLEEARQALTPGDLPDDRAIHEFRKAMKRHRALLRLVEPERGDLAIIERREAGAIAGTLAGARDLTAALDGIADLPSAAAAGGEPAAPVARALEARRAAAEEAYLDEAARARIGAFLDRAREAADALARLDIRVSDLVARIAAGYRRMRRAAPLDWAVASPDALHELRKRVVVHRYQVELLRPLWPRMIDVWVGEAQRLRDRLGQHQDLEALTRFLATEPDLIDARRRARLMAAVRTRQFDLAASAARQHARLAAEKPGAFRARLLAWSGTVEEKPGRDRSGPVPVAGVAAEAASAGATPVSGPAPGTPAASGASARPAASAARPVARRQRHRH